MVAHSPVGVDVADAIDGVRESSISRMADGPMVE